MRYFRSHLPSSGPPFERIPEPRYDALPGRDIGLKMEGPAMARDDIDKAIEANMKFTLELADKILLSAGTDPNDAFIKAIGTLAQVIYIITPDGQREQTLNDTIRSLKTYLELLDTLAGPQLAHRPAFALMTPSAAPKRRPCVI